VLIIGDRYEALSAALAAAYMNLPILHLQGGEVSGQHRRKRPALHHQAGTVFIFRRPKRAADYLVKMGEKPETILGVGCPSSDIARHARSRFGFLVVNSRGGGHQVDLSKAVLARRLSPGDDRIRWRTRTDGRGAEGPLTDVDQQVVLLWPNIDAGSDYISKAVREFRVKEPTLKLRNPYEPVARGLSQGSRAVRLCRWKLVELCARRGFLLGTPVVLVGPRQDGRERDVHVTRVDPIRDSVAQAIKAQLRHGPYAPSTLYGDGAVANRIARAVVNAVPYVQKRLAYAENE